MENISLTDLVRNKEVLQSVKEERNVLQTIRRRKTNWTGHFLRRNSLLKHFINPLTP
jgi:hypothetical protein